MDFGTLVRALGYGTVAGLGTAEEQRTRGDRRADRLAAALRHQEDLALRKRQLEEATKVHEQEWGMATPSELALYRPLFEGTGVLLPPEGAIRRRDLPGLVTAAGTMAGREPYVPMDPETGQPVGGVSRLPISPGIPGTGRPAETALLPPEAPETSENPVPSVLTLPTPERRAVPVKVGQVDDWAWKRRQSLKDRRTEESVAQKQQQVEAARAELGAGQTWEQIRGKYPLITAKDAIGYEPAAPAKPAAPRYVRGTDGSLEKVNPEDDSVTTIRPADSAAVEDAKAKRDLTKERLAGEKARNEREKSKDAALKSSEDLETLMRAGKPLPMVASRIVRELRSEAAALMKAAETFDLTDAERDEYATTAKDLMARSTKIATYRPGKPAGTSTLPKLSEIVPGLSLGTKAQSVAEKIMQGR